MHEHEIREDVLVAFQELADALFVERRVLGRDEDARSDGEERRLRDGPGSKREMLGRFVVPFACSVALDGVIERRDVGAHA